MAPWGVLFVVLAALCNCAVSTVAPGTYTIVNTAFPLCVSICHIYFGAQRSLRPSVFFVAGIVHTHRDKNSDAQRLTEKRDRQPHKKLEQEGADKEFLSLRSSLVVRLSRVPSVYFSLSSSFALFVTHCLYPLSLLPFFSFLTFFCFLFSVSSPFLRDWDFSLLPPFPVRTLLVTPSILSAFLLIYLLVALVCAVCVEVEITARKKAGQIQHEKEWLMLLQKRLNFFDLVFFVLLAASLLFSEHTLSRSYASLFLVYSYNHYLPGERQRCTEQSV